MAKDDAMDKIRNLIREEIAGSEAARERKALEEKDPWEKMRGIIREEIGTHFKDLGEGVEEGKRKVKAEDDEDKPKLGILGI